MAISKKFQKMKEAFQNDKTFYYQNTNVLDGVVLLYNTPIIKKEGGEVYFSLGNYPSKTTIKRIKDLLNVIIFKKNGVHYYENSKGEIIDFSSEQWVRVE